MLLAKACFTLDENLLEYVYVCMNLCQTSLSISFAHAWKLQNTFAWALENYKCVNMLLKPYGRILMIFLCIIDD